MVNNLVPARFRHSASFVEALRHLRCGLLISTYQAGKLIAVGVGRDGLRFSFHAFDQAMGVAARPNEIAVGTRGQIWRMLDTSELAGSIEPAGEYDRLYLPRAAHVTGRIQGHELAWGRSEHGNAELWVVNTAFSCLATLDGRHSFIPRWRPPFVTSLAAEDRCHLNGLAMRDGHPSAVTVMAPSDQAGGWREEKTTGGQVLDVETGEAVTTGLAMPHSPRWIEGRLMVLNSGHGTLETIDINRGTRDVIASLPGFTRGLARHGNLAFVGLSRIRETAVFGGLPIGERHEELKCGVAVVDLVSGRPVASLEFESGIEEIFDVQVLTETRCAALGGPEEGHEVWVVPVGTDGARALRASAEMVEGWVRGGLALHRAGRPADGAAELRLALASQPRSAAIANHLGNALQEAGDSEAALDAYRTAVASDASYIPALRNLGHMLAARGDTEQALSRLREAQAIEPSPLTRLLIATTLPVIYPSVDAVAEHGRRTEAELRALVGDGVQVDTTDTLVPTNFYGAYRGADDRPIQELLGRVMTGPDVSRPRPRSSNTRIRIGFLSAYFRDHTIGRLNLGRVERLDRERFEVVVLTAGKGTDPVAAAFQRCADRFVVLPSGVAAARLEIAAQQLDVLLFADVGMNPLTTTLARSRMAPVQCATWGHPVTTGSPTIDYFISSELLETRDSERHYTERLLRLGTLGTWYRRPTRPVTDGARARLGLSNSAHVYACPQTLFKLHPDFDPLLAEILRRDPDGIIVLIEGHVPRWTQLVRARLATVMGDAFDRIRWLPSLSRERYLELLALCDVVLDPLHFGGGNSSYESLGVSTPVITLPGSLLRGRITQALYAKAGYQELVANSTEEYVDLAVCLGGDPAAQARARAAITENCRVLFEDDAEVRDLETGIDNILQHQSF